MKKNLGSLLMVSKKCQSPKMYDEIKGMLDLLNFNRDTISDGTCRVEDFMSREQIIKFLDYITNLREEVKSANESITWWQNRFNALHKENELHNKMLKDANDVLNIQAQEGNYNYDSYMLGLYNGMEMIVSLFEQREPKFKCGKDIKFLHETDYKEKINE